ncbi:putative uncharacterized protein [Bacteroides sp. CAG:709]|nr:putative uncharacterized protein [Bacteroides sp. CAG:709]
MYPSERTLSVSQVFRLCANALKDAKNPRGFYFRRILSRGGHMQAIVATAHKIARIFYVMVKNKCAYDETKVGLDEQELLKKKIERTQRALNKLNARLSGAIG